MTNSSYLQVLELGKEIKHLESIARLLDWDRETMMPKNSADSRALQTETLSGHIHKLILADSFLKALNDCIHLETGEFSKNHTFTHKENACLREWRRDVNKAKKLPLSFVKEFARTTSLSVYAWDTAKQTNNFSHFLPHLEKVVALCQKKIDLSERGKHPYDTLLDDYEIGMTVSVLDPIFSSLKPFLIDLTKKLASKSHSQIDLASHHFDSHRIEKLNRLLLEKMGFNQGSLRVDASSHPFCQGIHPDDVRMTVHRSSSDIMKGHFSALMHEAGHGLYEMGLPKEHFGTPLCEAVSMGIHESQSKFWETLIGNSMEFLEYFHPHLVDNFPEVFNSISVEKLFKQVNQVRPSFIRIHADEVTYSLHVILRYEIEKGLFDGSIQPRDIPDIWNSKMKEYLGIVPKENSQGCLQDIHWGAGLFGYFPTYVLGNLYAAQFYEKMKQDEPHLKNKIREGNFSTIKAWLHQHIHRYGREFTPSELIEKATSKKLSEKPFTHYLSEKFG